MSAALAVSAGDPAGIGPDVVVRALCARPALGPYVVFGDAQALGRAFAHAGVGQLARARDVREVPNDSAPITVVHVAAWPTELVAAHAPTASGGAAQLASLRAAAEAVSQGRCSALVTAPTSKEAITMSGTPFVGQTEWLAEHCGMRSDEVTMMFLGPRLRVALVTTHLSVREVPDALTEFRIARACSHLAEALIRLRPEPSPQPVRIDVAGLNPHAGEHGLFGDEEARVIAPALDRARASSLFCQGRAVFWGPTAAETALRRHAAGQSDGVVTMFHDQATIASKLLDWQTAVNVTWGLPFVRTSVDHGVAYDAAAAASEVSCEGMVAAIELARQLSTPKVFA